MYFIWYNQSGLIQLPVFGVDYLFFVVPETGKTNNGRYSVVYEYDPDDLHRKWYYAKNVVFFVSEAAEDFVNYKQADFGQLEVGLTVSI